MDFNGDDTNFNDQNYSYEEDFQDLPLGCPFRQRPPAPGSPQGTQGRPPFPGSPQEPQGRPPFPGSPQGPQGRPPFPGSSQGPQGRPPFPGSPQGPQGGPPSAPPGFVPNHAQAHHFGVAPLVDAGAIRFCRFRFSYIWPRRGFGFWAWITFVGPRSIAGFRWERNRWVFFGMDLRSIDSFQCF